MSKLLPEIKKFILVKRSAGLVAPYVKNSSTCLLVIISRQIGHANQYALCGFSA
jgi:hypothetical protein